MMSVKVATEIANVLGGRVWEGNSVVRVYLGSGKSETRISVLDDGTLAMQIGRGVAQSEIEAKLYAAGLVTATEKVGQFGIWLDDVRLVEAPP